jgi:hypothetical protein
VRPGLGGSHDALEDCSEFVDSFIFICESKSDETCVFF